MENTYTKKPHAIMIPLHYQGHVTPSVNLAIKLASKGFIITFVNTEIVHHQITKSKSFNTTELEEKDRDIFAGARKSGLDIRYKTVSDGFPLSFDRFLNAKQFGEGSLHVFPAHVDELVGNLVREDPSVSCLIADTFFTWTSWIAKKYKLINVSFWTEPALVFTLYYHVDLLIQNGHFASNDNREDTIEYIPGVKAIEPKDLPSFFQSTDTNTLRHRIIYKSFEDVKAADFILCNTVQELESDTISAIQDKQPIYAIGPVLPSEFTKSIVPTSLKAEFDCSQWLNSKPQGSVLYVSFGSALPSKKSDIEEIAHGLALSGVNFIWVLRPDAVSYEEPYVLPLEIEDKIKDKGLIVQWCNQVEVISNPAIGGFLTHCGWNSVMESLRCGVPLLCFPLFTDQPTNRKLVVDDLRVGINLCIREPLTRSEVAQKINRLMSGKSAEELRKETMKVRSTSEKALAIAGSSEKNLCQFIDDVKDKISELFLENSNNR
ncbi:UDP-glycosyltransferase 86A1 [Morus notabilis]|uniref:Glycosyltransferase n=1 Tax=Morus notabilis TaxID=981085 RepID=W9S4Z3_9ROSA|nr:UDP-glycosyltransferase 86A1 [Morus notabilis]EXC16163.1 UDP-glycosyltransferase 86A1 [Morus notabilis]